MKQLDEQEIKRIKRNIMFQLINLQSNICKVEMANLNENYVELRDRLEVMNNDISRVIEDSKKLLHSDKNYIEWLKGEVEEN